MQSIARWKPILTRYGLDLGPTPGSWSAPAEGVELTLSLRADGPSSVAIDVAIPLAASWSTLSVASPHHDFAEARLLTGDPVCDEAVLVRCDDPSVLGVFDADGRVEVADLVAQGVLIQGGVLRIDDWATRALAAQSLAPLIERALTLARTLGMPAERRIRRLIEVAETDLVPEVRTRFSALRNHPALREAFARQVAIRSQADDGSFDTLRAQVLDPTLSLEVRAGTLGRLIEVFSLERLAPTLERLAPALLCARIDRLRPAMRRSAEDREVAVRLLSTLAADTAILPHQHIAVANALGDSGHPLAARPLGALATHRDRQVRIAALEALVALPIPGEAQFAALSTFHIPQLVAPILEIGRRKSPLGAPLVAACMPNLDPRNNVLQVGALNILGASANERVAPAIIPFLESAFEDVQVAAIEALGEVGALSEVARLTPLTEGFFRAGAIKSAAKAAVAALRERHRAQSLPGAVSLAADPTGALSVVPPPDDTPRTPVG